MSPEIKEIVDRYIDTRLEVLSQDVYSALSSADPHVSFEALDRNLRGRFNRAYAFLTGFGNTRYCEAEIANAIFKKLEDNAVFYYMDQLNLRAH